MENSIIELIKLVNPVQLGLIVLAMFYFYNRTDAKINKLEIKVDKLEERLTSEIRTTNSRIDKLEERLTSEIKAVNNRVDDLYKLMLDLYRLLSKRDAA